MSITLSIQIKTTLKSVKFYLDSLTDHLKIVYANIHFYFKHKHLFNIKFSTHVKKASFLTIVSCYNK